MFNNKKKLQKIPLIISLIVLGGCQTNYAQRPDVNDFINHMVRSHHFNRSYLRELFTQVKPNRCVKKSVKKPTENFLIWSNYRPILITPIRVAEGVQFWKAHAKTLAFAQANYGVPAETIVGILGVETRYGQIQGTYPVFNSLAILSFDYRRRSTFFKSELEEFLLLSREDPIIDLQNLKGSYAGAIGKAQFMPSSYRRYAVDSSRKGYSDLINNTDDAILSIANYLHRKGWIMGQPVTVPVKNRLGLTYNMKTLPNKPLSLNILANYHIRPLSKINPSLTATVIALEIKRDHYVYWLTFHNFDIIKTYNPSNLYALAVFQLGELIHEHYIQHNGQNQP